MNHRREEKYQQAKKNRKASAAGIESSSAK